MSQQQATVYVQVPVANGNIGTLEELRKLPIWDEVIKLFAPTLERNHVKEFIHLGTPVAAHAVWPLVRDGVPYRCCVHWDLEPTDGQPQGWRGRIDVAWDE